MSNRPVLVFLHGVTLGEPDEGWKDALNHSLQSLGYPGLDGVEIIAPRFGNTLHGIDDSVELPPITIDAPSGRAADEHRRFYAMRVAGLEATVGPYDVEAAWASNDRVVDFAVKLKKFAQAKNYVSDENIRAAVLSRILEALPDQGEVVIVAHSLGTVVASDLLRRLPDSLYVRGLVTIGSPLAAPGLQPPGMSRYLKIPPTNLAWWINFWNYADPVTTGRGISHVVPWVTDNRVYIPFSTHVHDSSSYLSDSEVATAIGYGLFGSLSQELVLSLRDLDIPVDYSDTFVLMALRFAHLVKRQLKGEVQERYSGAQRLSQAESIKRVTEVYESAGKRVPGAVSRLRVDLIDTNSPVPEPERMMHFSLEEAVVLFQAVYAANVIAPFDVSVPDVARLEAMKELAAESGLGLKFGCDVVEASKKAQKALATGPGGWIRWAAIGVGAAAIITATGGLALAAAPGVAGAAAITSALAAFGPGGMIGGLFTAGTLVGTGGGTLAVGLASSATSSKTVEATLAAQLAAALVRKYQGIDQDQTLWPSLQEMISRLQSEKNELQAFSDSGSPSIKRIDKKLRTVKRAIEFLEDEGLDPTKELLKIPMQSE